MTLLFRPLALALALVASAALAVTNDEAKSRHADREPGVEAIRAKTIAGAP